MADTPKQQSFPPSAPASRQPPGHAPQPPRGQGSGQVPARLNPSLPALQLPSPPLFRELDAAQRFLGSLADKVHVLSPVVNLDFIPEFHDLSVRYVRVDPRLNQFKQSASGDVYVQKGGGQNLKVSLTKAALDRLAGAAGITWHPTLSGRLDNASDRHYCHFRAVGIFRDIDGSVRTISGEKEIDLRDGNPGIFTEDEQRMKRDYNSKQILNPGYVAGWSVDRLEGAREHILAMAESKAKNRVIRQLGVKHIYDPQELIDKPFAVMKLVFTGRSDDPEMEKLAKHQMLADALGKSRGMFGPTAAPQVSLERDVTPAIEQHVPPPLPAEAKEEDDDVQPDTGTIDVTAAACGCPDAPAGIHEPTCGAGNDWNDL